RTCGRDEPDAEVGNYEIARGFTVAVRSGAGQMVLVVTTPRSRFMTPSPLRPSENVGRHVR
ncbi:MAG: hypothetical protein ACXVCO_20020, partial [Ktedonobacterales bacterium]